MDEGIDPTHLSQGLMIKVDQSRQLQSVANPYEKWTYIKYNLVFDWSGLAKEVSWLSRLCAWLSGGAKDRWHRLGIHLSAILAFDSKERLRLLRWRFC